MVREERRAQGIKRVPVERIVEICGRDPSVPAFEAESVELSGRGMHVRTPYLPELGAPLVCRLEERGREIVVEGVVAWRNPTDGGGEFGVKFTALDSGSVEALKELCGLIPRSEAEEAEKPVPAAVAPEHAAPAGAPVKLHIEGLAAPMKARVRRGGGKRLHVGSNLEFLKVGRSLEIEDLELRERKGARIDSVSVAIDPETQVPQLVVALRYEGVEDGDVTPEPSVIGSNEAEESPAPAERRPAVAPTMVSASRTQAMESADAVDALDEDEDDDDEDEDDLRARVEGFSSGAAKAARTVGGAMSRFGEKAAAQLGAAFRTASAKVGEIRSRQAAQKKRVTAKAPAPPPSTTNRRLRPQGGQRGADVAPGGAFGKKKVLAGGAVASLVVLGLVVAFAFGGSGEDKAAAAHPESAAPALAAASPAPSASIARAGAGPAKSKNGIVADVPLFGPTPMATLEPAPLEPPPEDGRETEADGVEEEASAGAPDETFDEPVAAAKVVPVEAVEKPAEPWVVGKLHLPFVHRIKLDAPGVALEGTKKSNGFSVFLPKRKLLESGKAIERRDDRIVEVRTSNEPGGARVTFVFQGKVPAYKVRLKKEYVEFFISSPQKS